MAQRSALARWGLARLTRLAERVSDQIGHVRLARITVATLRLLHRSSGGPRSAEIAYYSILSTIPFGALLLTALAYGAVDLLDAGWSRDQISLAVHDLLQTFLPTAGPEIDQAIGWLLDRRGALGAFGTATLLFTASLVFGAISRATGAIFDARPRDRFSTTFLFAAALCGLALVLLKGIPGVASLAQVRDAGVDATAAAYPIVFRVAMDALMVICFIFLLVTVVRVRLRLLHVIAGAGLFIGLFEAARYAFIGYLTYVSRLNLVYGSLASAMAAIVWAYYVAAALLISLCLVRVLNGRLWATSWGEILPHDTSHLGRRSSQ